MFTLLQVGNALKSINGSGGLSAALTLPTGVQLATNRIPRFAKFNQFAVVVNTPTRPISVDVDGTVRVLTPAAPTIPVALSGPDSGSLSGTFLARQTYKLLDASGNIIAESDYGPAMSAAVTIASKQLKATFVDSNEIVSATQLYRTLTNGAVYFPWAQVPGNTTTTYEDDQSDAAIQLVAAPFLGSAPDLTLICEWGGRLWGVDRLAVDYLRYTEAGTMYAWYINNSLIIGHKGADAAGIVALIPRRNALGVARRDVFQQVTGSTRDNFTATTISGGEQVGCMSQESVVVYKDIAYFLWRDGIYKWDANGISCITNGKVRSWFTSDTYFNRAMFWRAFAALDPFGLRYRLFLASAGSTTIDRWIEYDLTTDTWWGPHKTDAFQPTCALWLAGDDQQPYYMIGSQDGFLSQDSEQKRDWLSPIALAVETKKEDMGDAEREKYWGELSITGKAQTAGSITVTPQVGNLDSMTAQTPFTYDMTQGRQRLGRLGIGKYANLVLEHDVIDQDVALDGFEVDPVTIIGRR